MLKMSIKITFDGRVFKALQVNNITEKGQSCACSVLIFKNITAEINKQQAGIK